jgi:three-Cys-motif partner protein
MSRKLNPQSNLDFISLLYPEASLNDGVPTRPVFKRLDKPVWTEHKAHFIEKYLYYFVQITKHGTYIDGFAGPQRPDLPEAWSAKRVIESEPKWFRNFHLCELNEKSRGMLEVLAAQQPARDKKNRLIKRIIKIYPGDFNESVREILASGIPPAEATFCLLDQRTFECDWESVRLVANHKPEGHNKIEIFYFLAVGWLHRSLAATKGDRPEKWWGSANWRDLKTMSSSSIADQFVRRFQDELGYKWVMPFPIFAREEGTQVMYYMIHASDHDEAPKLMVRAYNRAVRTLCMEEQVPFNFKDVATPS